MIKRYRFSIVLCGLFFVISIFAGKLHNQKSSGSSVDHKDYPGKIPLDVKEESINIDKSSKKKNHGGEAYFMKSLQGNVDIDLLFKLLDEALEIRPRGFGGRDGSLELILVLKKIGEISPLRGIEKLHDIKGGYSLMVPLFAGWASKDPESAVNYYEEHKREFEDRDLVDQIQGLILKEYASHNPQKALDYFKANKSDLGKIEFIELQKKIMKTICDDHPDLIPQFIYELGLIEEGTDANEDLFFEIGNSWGKYNPNSLEWMKEFSEERITMIESGRIMGISKGNVDKIDELLFLLPEKEQLKVKEEIAFRLLVKGGPDMEKRANWIIDFWPESRMRNIELPMKVWLSEDTRAARAWVELLPDGKKKETLKKWCDEGMEMEIRL